MKINEDYRIERDKHNFIIVETRSTQKKDGTIGFIEVKNFYPTLKLACLAVIRKSVEVETMEAILDSINTATFQIEEAIGLVGKNRLDTTTSKN